MNEMQLCAGVFSVKSAQNGENCPKNEGGLHGSFKTENSRERLLTAEIISFAVGII